MIQTLAGVLAALALTAAPPQQPGAGAEDPAAKRRAAAAQKAEADAESPAAKRRAAAAQKAATGDESEAAKRRAAVLKRKEAPKGESRMLMRSKGNFMFSVEACARPESCDRDFLAEAEQRFMAACQACTTVERCEAERDLVKAGTAKKSVNPCSEETETTAAR